jgi:predicted DCC family thiol-disulfide oxidoreductase YuxK
VNFLLKADKKNRLLFSPLQSAHALGNLPEKYLKRLDTIVFKNDQGGIFEKSDAVIEIFILLGLPWKIFFIFKFLPKSVRNFFYTLVAQNRYSIFGKKDTCRLPTPEEKNKFIL